MPSPTLRDPQRGIVYKPDPTRGIECFVDADFAGAWSRADAESAENVMSRTGFVIMYMCAGCPIIWISKLQTEIALSTAEAEYIALSQATCMRQVTPCMNLLIEIRCVVDIPMPKLEVHCKEFEDNRGAITIAEANNFTPSDRAHRSQVPSLQELCQEQGDPDLSYRYERTDRRYLYQTFR